MPKIEGFERFSEIFNVEQRREQSMKLDTISNTTIRLKNEGYAVSEHALRLWVKRGEIPAIRSGNKSLLLYDTVVKYILEKAS